jgi:hypothetical protein
MSDAFLQGIAQTHKQARQTEIPLDTGISEYFREVDFAHIVDDVVFTNQTGPDYYAMPTNYLLNPSFETDLTSWTEINDATVTHTKVRDTSESVDEWGSLASLKINVSASSGAGDGTDIGYLQQIATVATKIWNIEVYYKCSTLVTSEARLRIFWRDSGQSSLGTANVVGSSTSWSTLVLENQVAPTSTAFLEVRLEYKLTADGGTGTVWYDIGRAEESALTELIPLEEAGIAEFSFAA